MKRDLKVIVIYLVILSLVCVITGCKEKKYTSNSKTTKDSSFVKKQDTDSTSVHSLKKDSAYNKVSVEDSSGYSKVTITEYDTTFFNGVQAKKRETTYEKGDKKSKSQSESKNITTQSKDTTHVASKVNESGNIKTTTSNNTSQSSTFSWVGNLKWIILGVLGILICVLVVRYIPKNFSLFGSNNVK